MIALFGLLLTGAPPALVTHDDAQLEARLTNLANSVAKLEASQSAHAHVSHLSTEERVALIESHLAHLAEGLDPDEDPYRVMDDFQLVAGEVSEELSGNHSACKQISVSALGVSFNKNVCVNLHYQTGSTPSANQVGITVTGDGSRIISYTMNAASLLRRCFPVPYISIASICVKLQNTHISLSSFATTIGLSLYAQVPLGFTTVRHKIYGPVNLPRITIP